MKKYIKVQVNKLVGTLDEVNRLADLGYKIIYTESILIPREDCMVEDTWIFIMENLNAN